MTSRATIQVPGQAPRELSLAPGVRAEVIPGFLVAGALAPGLLVEQASGSIDVPGRTLQPGERWLLLPGQSASAGGVRVLAEWEDPGTLAEARSLLLAALRGDPLPDGPALVALSGPSAGMRIHLRPGLLGRCRESENRLDDPTVSRRHARVEFQSGRVLVEDLGAKNGTWIEGKRWTGMRELRPGEELRAGGMVLALSPRRNVPPEATASPARTALALRLRPAGLLAVAAMAAATAALALW